MIYNKINQSKNEISLDESKEIVDFLDESQIHASQARPKIKYFYPSMHDEMTLWQKLMSDKLDGIVLLPTPKFAVFCNYLLSFYLALFGVIFFGVTWYILEIRVPYGIQCDGKPLCSVPIQVNQLLPVPSYVYVEMTNFYSNDKSYTDQIPWDQFAGKPVDIADCGEDLIVGGNVSAAGFQLYKQNYSNPCGRAVKNIFNDSFVLYNADTQMQIDQSQLTLKMYFQGFQRAKQWQFTQWVDVLGEHFVNWFTIQPQDKRFFLWGVMNINFPAGNYVLYIQNNFPIGLFGGEKTLIFSSSSELGSRNLFLGGLLVAGSGMCFLSATIIFFIKRSHRLTQVAPSKQD